MDAIIAIDQGTSSTRVLAFDLNGKCLASSQLSITQYYPKDGWVEHCADEIYDKTAEVLMKVIRDVNSMGIHIACLGITNQRETTILWDKVSGKPIHKAIVWQDRRTQSFCQTLQAHSIEIKTKTGLQLDPYFSASKLHCLLNNCPNALLRAQKGELAFGTIDSYLIWRLTGGQHHKTDVTNASRTLLYNINEFCWDDDLLNLFGIPQSVLPEVLPCDGFFGNLNAETFGCELPITGVIGDQQAASIGQQCYKEGDAKITFGTGAFLMVNTGKVKQKTKYLLSTISYQTKHEHAYAVEGSIFNAGSIIQWLRDKLGVLSCVSESQMLAKSATDNGGVYLVPAFTGLGAPYWQTDARAMLMGLQLDSNKAHIVRAGLESVAYQVNDLLQTLTQELDINLKRFMVDGGMSVNQWLMQFISDLCQLSIVKPKTTELTAMGAAMMAGLGYGLFNDFSAFKSWHKSDWQCIPEAPKAGNYQKWLEAVNCCRGFSHGELS